MTSPQPRTRSVTSVKPMQSMWRVLQISFLTLVLVCAALAVAAEEKIIKSHGYSVFGELKYGPDFAHLEYVNPDAPKGGEISIWAPGTFDSMNPYSRKGNPGRLSSISIERLMTAVADEPGADYGLLAESLEYPESEDWVIFNLRPEAKFSDGTPVTAEDAVFTFNLLMEQALPSYREAIKKLVESAEVVDTHRVKFTFREGVPRDGLISQMGSNPVMSKKWFEETGARLDEGRLEQTLGTSPYVLDSYDINRRIVYRRNPDYWGNDLPINKGQNNFDTIRVEYFADSNAALEGFKAGAYSFRVENNSKTWATAYDFPAVNEGTIVKEALPNGSLPVAAGFVFNLQREKFQDIRVREAIGLMYNFEWTNETLQFGLFKQRESFWQGSDLAADGVAEGDELELLKSLGDLIDPSLLTEPAVKAHTSGQRQLDRKNLRRASALLDEAGWLVGDDGMRRNAAGQTFDLEFIDDTPTTERIATPYVENLKRLGINARFNRIDPAQFAERRKERDFDMIYYTRYATSEVPGLGMSQRFGSEDAKVSLFNPAGFANPAADAVIRKLEGTKTREEFKTTTKALDRIMRAQRFIVPTWYNGEFWVAYYDQYEHPENLPPYDLGYLSFWWYNAEKGDALAAKGVFQK